MHLNERFLLGWSLIDRCIDLSWSGGWLFNLGPSYRLIDRAHGEILWVHLAVLDAERAGRSAAVQMHSKVLVVVSEHVDAILLHLDVWLVPPVAFKSV